MHYHFGDFSTEIAEAAEYYHSNWRSEIESFTANAGCTPTSTYVHDCSSSFRKGTGLVADKAKTRLYVLDYGTETEVDLDNCCFIIVSRSDKTGDGKTGNVYTIVNFDKPGNYSIQFKAAAWTTIGSANTNVYIYPKPDGTLEDGDNNGFKTLNGVENKTLIGSPMPTTKLSSSSIEDKTTGKWPNGVETFEYMFNIPAAGEYVLEWATLNGNKDGIGIGNFIISTMGSADLSTGYVKKLNTMVASAEEKLAEAEPAKYRGADYNALMRAIREGKAYKGNYPSKYDSVVAHINDAITTMTLRMDTVNLFYTTEGNVTTKLTGYSTDELAKFKELDTYKALESHLNANVNWDCSVKATADITAEITNYESEMKALDNRMAAIDDFAAKIAETKALIDAADARADYVEYTDMVSAYNVAAAFDVVKPADDALANACSALVGAKNQYLFKLDYYLAKTRQVKELYALAELLGHDFGGKDIKSIVDALEDDDAKLSEVLREASIVQINKVYASKNKADIQKLDSLDVSALIPNYFLYNEAQVDRDMEKNSSGNWRLKRVENKTVIPGWTMTPSSGNWYFVKPSTGSYVAGAYMDWEAEGHTFIGGLRSGTSTKGVLTTEVTDLPEGYYKVGLYAYNQTSDLAYEFKTDSVDYSGKVNVDMNGGSKFNFKEVGMDSVLVAGNLIYTIDQKSSSSSEFEMRTAVLRLRGVNPECDYAAAVTKHQNKLNELITIVDAPVLKAGVEYFNLSGMKVDAPKAGEILIRKTTENGKVVVNKVLIK